MSSPRASWQQTSMHWRNGLRPFAAKAEPWLRESRALLVIGMPLAATQLAQIAIMTIDVIMIGALGAEHLAAAALATTIYFTAWMTGMGPVAAVSPIIAQAVGANPGERNAVATAMRMGIWAAVLVSIPLALLFVFAESLLLMIGQTPELAARAAPYVMVLGIGLPFSLAFTAVRNFATALSKPNSALVVVIITTMINAGLNYVLIFGHFGAPRLELVGAGIASVIANAAGFFLLLGWVRFAPFFKEYCVTRNLFVPDWDQLKELFRIGMPIGLTMMFEGGLFNMGVVMMGWVGLTALAAHQIAVNVASLTFMVPLGLAMGGVVRVGLAAGAKDPVGVRRAGITVIGISSFFMLICGFVFLVFPRTIAGLYIDVADPANAEVVELAVTFLRIAALFQLFDAIQVTGAYALRGLKDTRTPMWLAGLSYWMIGFPACLILAFGVDLGGAGIWYGFVIGLAAASVAMGWRFQRMSAWFSQQVSSSPAIAGAVPAGR